MRRNAWTPDEDAYLRAHLADGSVDIGRALGRPFHHIETRRRQLKLRVRPPRPATGRVEDLDGRAARRLLAEALTLTRRLCVALAVEREAVPLDRGLRALGLTSPEYVAFLQDAIRTGAEASGWWPRRDAGD
jgi:hypothetical protein